MTVATVADDLLNVIVCATLEFQNIIITQSGPIFMANE